MDRLLEQLIAIPSVCDNLPEATRIIDVVESRLRVHPLYITRFESNGFPSLIATTRKTKNPKVMLAAHLDVVAAHPDSFRLRLERGTYYGRGVLDMKAAAAAYIHVIDELGHRLKGYDIGIMFTTDEEYHGEHGVGMLVDKGYLPEVCILPDSGFGTLWHIEESAKGCWLAHVTALGINAHGSRPWEGESASMKLIQALAAITDLFKDAQKPDTATLNIGLLEGGGSINQIPAAAMGSLDIRFNDTGDFYRLRRKIQAICERYDVSLHTVRSPDEPTRQDLTHPLVTAFTKHVTLQTGIVPKAVASYGTSDARFLAAKGVPCILMSPPGGGAHSKDEWLSKEGYEQFQLILRDYLDEIATLSNSNAPPTNTDALTIPA